MGNKLVARACETIEAYKSTVSVDDLWEKLGWGHLVGSSDESLRTAPVFLEIKHSAERVFARRIALRDAEKVEVGDEILAVPPKERRPRPLRRFVVQAVKRVSINRKVKEVPVWPARVFNLHPTKGWRGATVRDASDMRVETKDGTPVLREWPSHDYGRNRAA